MLQGSCCATEVVAQADSAITQTMTKSRTCIGGLHTPIQPTTKTCVNSLTGDLLDANDVRAAAPDLQQLNPTAGFMTLGLGASAAAARGRCMRPLACSTAWFRR